MVRPRCCWIRTRIPDSVSRAQAGRVGTLGVTCPHNPFLGLAAFDALTALHRTQEPVKSGGTDLYQLCDAISGVAARLFRQASHRNGLCGLLYLRFVHGSRRCIFHGAVPARMIMKRSSLEN